MYSGKCMMYNLPFVNQLKSDQSCPSLPIGACYVQQLRYVCPGSGQIFVL